MTTQPEALRLAEQLENTESARLHLLPYAATELRRLSAQADLDTALLRQALEVLETTANEVFSPYNDPIGEVILALRKRLGQE